MAAVKVSEQAISLDQPGKDSDRYAQAGANGVALAGRAESGFRFPERLQLRDILRVLESVSAPDVILVEGAEDDFVPRCAWETRAYARTPCGPMMGITTD